MTILKCDHGPNAGLPGVCPEPHADTPSPEQPSAPAESPEEAQGVEEAQSRLGAFWQKMPPGMQKAAATTFSLAKKLLYVNDTPLRLGLKLAREVARQRGLPAEHVEKVAGIVHAWDQSTTIPGISVNKQLLGAVLGPAALAANSIPVAALCYVGYSACRNPLAVIRAACKMLANPREALKRLRRKGDDATRQQMGQVFDALEEAGPGAEWMTALIAAASDRAETLEEALALAQEAFRDQDAGKQALAEALEELQAEPVVEPQSKRLPRVRKAGSWFQSCPRDEEGHCKPKGEAGAEGSDQAAASPKEQPSAPRQQYEQALAQYQEAHAAWEERGSAREQKIDRFNDPLVESNAHAANYTEASRLLREANDAANIEGARSAIASFRDHWQKVERHLEEAGAQGKEMDRLKATRARAEADLGRKLDAYAQQAEKLQAAKKVHQEMEAAEPPEPPEPTYPPEPQEADDPPEPTLEDFPTEADYDRARAEWDQVTDKIRDDYQADLAEYEQIVDRLDAAYEKAHDKWETEYDRWQDRVSKLEEKVESETEKLDNRFEALDETLDKYIDPLSDQADEAAAEAIYQLEKEGEADEEPEEPEEPEEEEDDSEEEEEEEERRRLAQEF